jgi:hypothetical protein
MFALIDVVVYRIWRTCDKASSGCVMHAWTWALWDSSGHWEAPDIWPAMCGRYVSKDQAAIERVWSLTRGGGDPFGPMFNAAQHSSYPSSGSIPNVAANSRCCAGGLSHSGPRTHQWAPG